MPIRLVHDQTVAMITIDRPERRNAINGEMLEELDAAFAAALEAGARSVVISGAAGHFCAGADLKELEDLAFTERLREVLDVIAEAPVPVFAAISGACMGLGMQLAIASDIVVATDDAYFGVPVAKLGLMVDHWTLQRLVARLGSGTVRLLTMTAEQLNVTQAQQQGLVQVVGDHDTAMELAHRVAGLAPLTLAGTKLGLNLLERLPVESSYVHSFRTAWESADLVEGRAAFAERRKPIFRGE